MNNFFKLLLIVLICFLSVSQYKDYKKGKQIKEEIKKIQVKIEEEDKIKQNETNTKIDTNKQYTKTIDDLINQFGEPTTKKHRDVYHGKLSTCKENYNSIKYDPTIIDYEWWGKDRKGIPYFIYRAVVNSDGYVIEEGKN